MNGYKNYETWAASLWIENESGRQAAINELAETMKSDIEENSPLDVGLYADLLNAAISYIDFTEVAKQFADE